MSLGILTVDLVANIAKFESDLGRAARATDKRAKEMHRSIKESAIAMGEAFLAVGSVAAIGIKRAIDQADNLSKAAQKVGVDVENLSKLKFAGNLSDVNFDVLTSSLAKLNKASVAAAEGSKEQGEAFDRLGIKVLDQNGRLKSTNELLYEVADAYAATADDAAKTANAMAIFGKSGADLIPLLNSGASGLREMGDEAQRLGVVMNDKAAKSAEQFNDNLTRMQAGVNGLFNQLSQSLLPSMERISNEFIESGKQAAGFDDTVRTLDTGVRAIATGFIVISTSIRAAGQALGNFAAATSKFNEAGLSVPITAGFGLLFSPEKRDALRAGFGILKQGYGDVVDIASSSMSQVAKIWDEQGKAIEGSANAATSAAERLKKATQLSLQINALQGRINSGASSGSLTAGNDRQELARLTREYERLTGATVGSGQASIGFAANADKARAAVDNYAKSLEDMREAGRRHTQDMLAEDDSGLQKQIKQQQDFQKYTQRQFDLQGLAPEDEQRLGGIMDAADQYNTQLEAIAEFYANKSGLEDEANAASVAALIAYNARVNALNQNRADTDVRIDQEAKSLQLLSAINFGQSAVGLIGQFAGQSKAARLVLFAFEKALAISEIIINTNVAASKAGAQLGIFGISAATLIRAQGAASVALVAATGVLQARQIDGGRANGGPVGAGRLYEVGEGNQPELLRSAGKSYLIPGNGGGTVVPSRAGGSNVTVNVENYSGGETSVQREKQPNGDEIYTVFVGRLRQDIAQDGPFSRQMRSSYKGLQRESY